MAQNALAPNNAGGFDPSRYLTKVGNADYLEVKWRLVWLREDAPDAIIETQAVSIENDFAVFRAKVSLPTGGSATGYGSESMSDFRDYIEKAETKALGRALAALGFGTQFCPDFDFGSGQGRGVDAPIDFSSTRGRRLNDAANSTEQRIASPQQAATPRQLKFLRDIARESGQSDDALNDEVLRTYGKGLPELTRHDASALIERLQARKAAAADFSDGAAVTPEQPAESENGHPVTEPTAKERTKDYREMQNGHYYAATTERGFTEAAQKLYALAPFPDKTSRRDLTGQELHDLALQVKDDVSLMEDGSPPPTVDYANRIAAAIDRAELARIAAEMRSAGVAADWLRAMWKRRNDEVPAMVMVAETRIAGVAGDDKHTQ